MKRKSPLHTHTHTRPRIKIYYFIGKHIYIVYWHCSPSLTMTIRTQTRRIPYNGRVSAPKKTAREHPIGRANSPMVPNVTAARTVRATVPASRFAAPAAVYYGHEPRAHGRRTNYISRVSRRVDRIHSSVQPAPGRRSENTNTVIPSR